MFKKLFFILLSVVFSGFLTIANAFFEGPTLYIHNHSSVPVQVRERYTLPFIVPAFGGYDSLSAGFWDTLYDVGLYYLSIYGYYVLAPNCYIGNMRFYDIDLYVHDAYINGYYVPACY